MLSKSDIFNCPDSTVIEVEVPEWDGTVCLKSLSGTELDAWERYALTPEGKTYGRANLVAHCVCDDQRNRLFSDEDIPALSEKSAKPLAKLFNRCVRMNGIGDKDLKEIEKN